MSEKFSLKWNKFHFNVSKSFGILRDEDYLQDVTLVGDDHSQISGHKLVLSACSEYFKEIFKRNKHSSTLVCLEGIFEKDLKDVLDYMYNGEVNLLQEDLERFLGIAKRLKLEGLLEREDIPEEVILRGGEQEYFADTENVTYNGKNDLKTIQNLEVRSVQRTVSINGSDLNEIDAKIEENLEFLEDGHFRCRVCGKDSTGNLKTTYGSIRKSNMKYHIEKHIEGLSFTCDLCGKEYRSRDSVRKHKSLCLKKLTCML